MDTDIVSLVAIESFNAVSDNRRKFDIYAAKFLESLLEHRRIPLHYAGKTHLWDGTKYVVCDEVAMLVREWMKKNKHGQSNNLVGNVVPCFQSLGWRDHKRYGPMPFWCGRDACPFSDTSKVVAFNNGLLDLGGDGGLTPHTPNWCSATSLPFAYDPAATCPQWLAFLDEVFEGDHERVELLQEFMGYCLTPDTRYQKALVMCGQSRSGKGTISGVLKRLLGDGYTGFNLNALLATHGPTQLRNKLVAVVGEVELPAGPDRVAITGGIKNWVGGDEMSMNEKHCPLIVSERVTARLVMCCNSMPTLYDASGALANRLLVLPFQVSFAGREDVALESKLATELPGVANWAVAGLRRLTANGKFTTGKASAAAGRAFAAKTAAVRQWVIERAVVDKAIDPGYLPPEAIGDQVGWTATTDLYDDYCHWCMDRGDTPQESPYFGQQLRTAVDRLQPKRPVVKGVRVVGYVGIRLRTTAV